MHSTRTLAADADAEKNSMLEILFTPLDIWIWLSCQTWLL